MPIKTAGALLLAAAGLAAADGSGREQVPRRWWESAAGIVRVSLKPGRMGQPFPLQPAKAAPILDQLKARGVGAIEIFAPAEGGRSFSGLDTINRYRIEPELGTMDDFRALVRLIHSRGLAAISFDNLGYSSVEAVEFLKACDDVKAGRNSPETRFFLWSDSADAPPPGSARGDTFFMVRPTHLPGSQPGTFYDSSKHEFWAYSERAGKYYWTKWAGVDRQGNRVRLPQYNWASPEFQQEAEKIVRFWMDTGLDGMIIDAVNWYVDYTWAKGRRRLTNVIAGYGNAYSQPEGAGGFHEDPVAWITEGGWNSVQDYGLGIWWEKDSNVVQKALDSGDPRPIERALRDYHDPVAAAGGVLYFSPPKFDDARKANLALALVSAVGDLVALGGGRYAGPPDAEQGRILNFKRQHPALHQLGRRQPLRTNADDKYYAFLRAAGGGERVLVVMNFQPGAQTIEVDLSGVDCETLTSLDGSGAVKRQSPWRVELPAYGYRFYQLSSAVTPPARSKPAARWWESEAATIPVFLKDVHGKGTAFPLVPDKAAKRLDEIRAAGIGAIEVYAPAEAGNSFLGLDTINRYRLDPAVGTIDDFRRLVRLVHAKGMKIIGIDNLGYSSVEAVDFLKACDDLRAGRRSRETSFYIWSDSADAPPPGSAGRLERYFFVRPGHLAPYNPLKHEFWQYSERAGKYYWTKWAGVDLAGKPVRLPQYNWASPEFQDEARKIVRFWMDTGLDGMLIDAVNWYPGCDWRICRRSLTGVISSYGEKFSQPEGAGGFHEDPVPWITEGGWTCVQDYGLGIFWEKGSNVVVNAIESGDPRPLERAFRDYHDRVVAAGGTLYFNPPKFEDPRKSHLATALAAAAGDLLVQAGVVGGKWSPIFPDAEESRILKLKAVHPALHNLGRRRPLPVADPAKHYAFLRVATEGGERILAVMNFQPEDQVARIDLSGVDFDTMTDLDTGATVERQSPWRIPLPAYGYRFYRLNDTAAR